MYTLTCLCNKKNNSGIKITLSVSFWAYHQNKLVTFTNKLLLFLPFFCTPSSHFLFYQSFETIVAHFLPSFVHTQMVRSMMNSIQCIYFLVCAKHAFFRFSAHRSQKNTIKCICNIIDLIICVGTLKGERERAPTMSMHRKKKILILLFDWLVISLHWTSVVVTLPASKPS